MTQVWQRLNCSGGELLLALALADIADDAGNRIYPGVATLAFKTRQSERQVQRQLKKFKSLKWLQVSKASKGRATTRYRINPAWINGDILSGFEDVQPRHLEHPTMTFETSNHDTAMSPNPSVSINNHKKRTREKPSVSRATDEAKRRKIRETIWNYRLSSQARDLRFLASMSGATPEEVQREMASP